MPGACPSVVLVVPNCKQAKTIEVDKSFKQSITNKGPVLKKTHQSRYAYRRDVEFRDEMQVCEITDDSSSLSSSRTKRETNKVGNRGKQSRDKIRTAGDSVQSGSGGEMVRESEMLAHSNYYKGTFLCFSYCSYYIDAFLFVIC